MKRCFCDLIQSPDANEGALRESNYSTERSPRTALLFEAKRTVVLPVITLENELSPHEPCAPPLPGPLLHSAEEREKTPRVSHGSAVQSTECLPDAPRQVWCSCQEH